MFKLLKWLFILAFLAACVVVVLSLVMPKDYLHETSVDIAAPSSKVYTYARNLNVWHVVGMIDQLANNEGLAEIGKQLGSQVPNIPGVNVDSLVTGAKDAEILNMKLKLISAEPSKIVYKVIGGPVDSIQPEILIESTAAKQTRVTIREKFQYDGFFAGAKALAARYGSGKINENSLSNLKKICEAPEK